MKVYKIKQKKKEIIVSGNLGKRWYTSTVYSVHCTVYINSIHVPIIICTYADIKIRIANRLILISQHVLFAVMNTRVKSIFYISLLKRTYSVAEIPRYCTQLMPFRFLFKYHELFHLVFWNPRYEIVQYIYYTNYLMSFRFSCTTVVSRTISCSISESPQQNSS